MLNGKELNILVAQENRTDQQLDIPFITDIDSDNQIEFVIRFFI